MEKRRAITWIEVVVILVIVAMLATLLPKCVAADQPKSPPTKYVYRISNQGYTWRVEFGNPLSDIIDSRYGFRFNVDGRDVRLFGTFTIEQLPGD